MDSRTRGIQAGLH